MASELLYTFDKRQTEAYGSVCLLHRVVPIKFNK